MAAPTITLDAWLAQLGITCTCPWHWAGHRSWHEPGPGGLRRDTGPGWLRRATDPGCPEHGKEDTR